jgi:hypothetical protein
MNVKTGSIDQFEEYSKFTSLKEFNSHFEMWMSKLKEEFSKGELVALKRLVRYSAKLPGVSNAKIGTMLKAIHEEYNGNGISRSTDYNRHQQRQFSFRLFRNGGDRNSFI